MHLVRIDAVSLDEGEAAVDLGQAPGDLVVLSFTDSDLAGIGQAYAAGPGLPSLRLAKLAKLRHPMSVDLYVERVVAHAKVVVIRCLGGLDYWRYGVERCSAVARAHGVVLAVLPGDDRPDPRLGTFSTDPDLAGQLDAYFRAGGPENLRRMLHLLAARAGMGVTVEPPQPLPRGFPWCAGCGVLPLDIAVAAAATAIPLADVPARSTPLALLLVYRSAVLGRRHRALRRPHRGRCAHRGIGVLPMAVSSLKESEAADAVAATVRARKPDLVIAATAFSAREDGIDFVLDGADCPVLQAFTVGAPRRRVGGLGAGPRRGRPRHAGRASGIRRPALGLPDLLQGGVHRKSRASPSAGPCPTQPGSPRWRSAPPAGCGLPPCPGPSARVALVLSDYPARGGRAGFAVGLDTPESARAIVADLTAAGYAAGALPERRRADGGAHRGPGAASTCR